MPDARAPASRAEPLWSRLSESLAAQMGLHYPRERWRDLQRGVAAAAPAFGMASAEACARWLLSAPLSREQIETLAACLTIGETYFFRDRGGFDALEQRILPALMRARPGVERRLRIWSAGCATGEEPYSIAMLLAGRPELQGWNVSILATDIDPDFLRKASQGIYSEWSFRGGPPELKQSFFRKTRDGRFEILPRIKAMVSFAYVNLATDSFPSVENGTNAMDVIFCRNVLMYFEPAGARRVIAKLGNCLLPHGWLFVSPVEAPQVPLPRFVPVAFPGALVHRKDGTAAGAVPVEVPETPAPVSAAGLRRKAVLPSKPVREPAPAPARTPHQEAASLYEQGRYADTVRAVHGILSQRPDDAAAMALLARAHANRGQLGEALEWCDKALASDRLNAGWCYLRATILQEQGLVDAATASLRTALYLDQNHALAHFALGTLVRRQGRRKDADRHFRNALSILSTCPQEQLLPESEGMTAGRLAEIVRSTLSGEARA